MAIWLMQSDALGVVKILLWASALTSLTCFLTDRYLHSLLKTHWKPMIICVALVVLWRIPTEGGFFHGTEYEDSYVYTVAGRQMAEHLQIAPSGATLPYSINVCAVGSLTSCKQSDNFPEHLIGYPYIISVFSNILGYRPSIGSIANVVCACFADILIFLLCMVIADDVIAAASAALIFAITPVFAVWGLETSAEPVSNGCMSLALWWCLRYAFARPERSSRWHPLVTWCAFTTTLLFSLTVKRENILLAMVLPVIVFLVQFFNKRSQLSPIRNAWWIVLSSIIALIFSLQMKLFQSMGSETVLLNKFPITSGELIRLLPVFLRSFLVVNWYGGAAILVLIGAAVAGRKRSLALFPLLLFIAYVLLYAFHIRSYYEMQSGNTDPRAALRFSMSLMSMWSILAGLGSASLFGWFQRTRSYVAHRVLFNWIAACTLVVVAGVSFLATISFREDVAEDEFRMRIEPSLTAVRVAVSDQTRESYIVTLEPLIPQMYSRPSVDVVSLPELDGTVMKEIGFSGGATDVLYLDEQIHRTPADAVRYKTQLEYLNQFQHDTLINDDGFSVVRIGDVTEVGTHSDSHPQ
jgi:hypothetical protein